VVKLEPYCEMADVRAVISLEMVACPAEAQSPRSRVVPVSIAAGMALVGVSAVFGSIMV